MFNLLYLVAVILLILIVFFLYKKYFKCSHKWEAREVDNKYPVWFCVKCGMMKKES
jgi:hypothetical protein